MRFRDIEGRAFKLGLVAVLIAAAAALAVWLRRAPDPDRLFRQARSELAAGRPERAAALVTRLERVRAPNEFDRLLRAQVADARHRPDEAVAELAFIPDTHPLAPVARLLVGQVEVKRNRLRAAEAAFLATIALEPNSPNPRHELVYIYNLQHRQADLDAQFYGLSQIDVLGFTIVTHWGKTRNVVWKPERDVEKLTLCVEADPDDRASRLALAEGLQRLNKIAEAERVLTPLPASDYEAQARRADLALARGDQAGADQILASGPTDHPALARMRGFLALSRGEVPAAVRNLEIAYAADPTDRSVLQKLGSALRLAGDEAGAEAYLAASRRHDAITPLITIASTAAGAKDPALPARLGIACEAAGRLYEALAWYKLAILRDPLDRASQEAIFRTSRLIAERAVAAKSARPPSTAGGPTG
jgi:tetratricopeptide (TPR) repeat protein